MPSMASSPITAGPSIISIITPTDRAGLDWSNQPESRLRLLVQTEAVKALRQSLRSGVVEINGGGGENVGLA